MTTSTNTLEAEDILARVWALLPADLRERHRDFMAAVAGLPARPTARRLYSIDRDARALRTEIASAGHAVLDEHFPDLARARPEAAGLCWDLSEYGAAAVEGQGHTH